MGAFTLVSELYAVVPFEPASVSIGIEALGWLPSIQHLTLALNRTPSLLNDDPTLNILLIKNILKTVNCGRLNEFKTDEFF